MTKEELYHIQEGDLGSVVAAGLKKNFEGIVDDVAKKQETLVSGTNIKTINGQSVLGEGNIEISGSGGGIEDAPSDGKKYVRQNGEWVVIE